MAIEVLKVLSGDGDSAEAVVRHDRTELAMKVMTSIPVAEALIGQRLRVEFAHDSVGDWRIFDDVPADHGLYGVKDGTIRVVGRVHNIVDAGDGEFVIDVYIQRGPEFVAVTSTELGGVVPPSGSGIELRLCGMRAYPTGV